MQSSARTFPSFPWTGPLTRSWRLAPPYNPYPYQDRGMQLTSPTHFLPPVTNPLDRPLSSPLRYYLTTIWVSFTPFEGSHASLNSPLASFSPFPPYVLVSSVRICFIKFTLLSALRSLPFPPSRPSISPFWHQTPPPISRGGFLCFCLFWCFLVSPHPKP